MTYTETQRRMLAILGAGQPVTRQRLCEANGVGWRSSVSTMRVQLCELRKRIKTVNPLLEIVTIRAGNQFTYCLVKQVPATLADLQMVG